MQHQAHSIFCTEPCNQFIKPTFLKSRSSGGCLSTAALLLGQKLASLSKSYQQYSDVSAKQLINMERRLDFATFALRALETAQSLKLNQIKAQMKQIGWAIRPTCSVNGQHCAWLRCPYNGERYSSSFYSEIDMNIAFSDWLSRLRFHASTSKLLLQGQSSVSLRRT